MVYTSVCQWGLLGPATPSEKAYEISMHEMLHLNIYLFILYKIDAFNVVFFLIVCLFILFTVNYLEVEQETSLISLKYS